MVSLSDVSRLVDEVKELSGEVRRNILSFIDDFQSFKAIMPERLRHALERCRGTEDVEKCLEELAEELKYLIERMDTMTEELNTAYNALRELIVIYHRKIKPMLGK